MVEQDNAAKLSPVGIRRCLSDLLRQHETRHRVRKDQHFVTEKFGETRRAALRITQCDNRIGMGMVDIAMRY